MNTYNYQCYKNIEKQKILIFVTLESWIVPFYIQTYQRSLEVSKFIRSSIVSSVKPSELLYLPLGVIFSVFRSHQEPKRQAPETFQLLLWMGSFPLLSTEHNGITIHQLSTEQPTVQMSQRETNELVAFPLAEVTTERSEDKHP